MLTEEDKRWIRNELACLRSSCATGFGLGSLILLLICTITTCSNETKLHDLSETVEQAVNVAEDNTTQ